jgi:hypothetical protein
MARRVDRSKWVGGVVHSFEELADVDREWWLRLTPSERIALVTELSEEADWSRHAAQEAQDQEGTVTRLLGSLGGVRRM